MRWWTGSMSGSSEMSPPGSLVVNAGSNVSVARSRNWNPPTVVVPLLIPIPSSALLFVASMDTPVVSADPPEKPIVPDAPSVRGLVVTLGSSPVPFRTQTSWLLAVHTVCPVTEFDAQELIASVPVGMSVLVMLVPSTLTASTPVAPLSQLPLGTYERTFVPWTKVEMDPDPSHEPWGTVPSVTVSAVQPLDAVLL